MKRKVAVIIDDFDYPIRESVKLNDFDEIRKMLLAFYSILKPLNDEIRFCFVTGTAKMPYSGLDNLVDISEEDFYRAILGYTESDLDRYFPGGG